MDDFYGLNKLVEENGGVENFRCFALLDQISGYVSGLIACGGKQNWVECRITEATYPLSEGYKVTLVPVDPDCGYAYENYYQSDFMSMIKSGHIIVKTDENMKVVHDVCAEPLCGDAYIVHEGDFVTANEERYNVF